MPSSSLIGKKRGRDHVTRATESTATISSASFVKNNSFSKKSSNNKNKDKSRVSSSSSSSKPTTNDNDEDNTPIVEDEPSASSKSGGSFGSALSKILSRDIDNKSNPVLAKRHTVLQKLREKEMEEYTLQKKQNKQRKLLRKSHNIDPRQAAPDFEKQLRKVATKGVVALFNAIAKHQHSVEIAEQEATRTSEKVKIVAAKQASFLDLLKHGVQEQQQQQLSTHSSTKGIANSTTLSSSSSNNKKGWSVLSDTMVNMAGKMKKSNSGNTGSSSNNGTSKGGFSDDDEDNENDIPDVLDSDSDDNGY